MTFATKIETFGPSVLVAIIGLAFLAQLTFAATPTSKQIGVIVPPWRSGGLIVAAGFAAPIIDLRWGGHLIVLDVSNDPSLIERLHKSGMTLIATDIRAGCDPTFAKVTRYET